jgi:two-component system, OmpR family, sensor kinase
MPIRLKLTLAFAAVMAVVLGATGLFLYLRFSATLSDTIDEGLDTRLADVRALVRHNNPSLPSSDLLVERGERLAQVLDSRGRVLGNASHLGTRPTISGEALAEARHGRMRIERTELPGLDTPVRLLAAPVRTGGRTVIVVVGSALDDRDEELAQLRTLLLLGGPIALLLASAAGYLLATAALRPVEAMRRQAADISAGEPGRRLPVPAAGDEIARLGHTLNEMLERLEAAFARERSFVSDASHELRTPLAILKTELELALRSGRSTEELREALRSAGEETDRLTQLADDLLVIARSDQGRLPIRTAPVDVRDLLESVRRRFARRAGEAGIDLRVAAPPGLRAELDSLRVEQGLGNLVDNALRYGDGPIDLVARERAGGLELAVRDRGPGFPPEFVDHAFERFTRADTGRSSGGAGLGLAIVQAIAAAHGGVAEVRDVEGDGAEVAITL